ncbi:MAG: carboxypeptidase regulatory-like domain-containing protein [Chitinispirillaceae bacterium]|nr:carboxypeptidase regulatory-like domain-containing protein [Chitinispirillaceae bacterium]
MFFRLIPLFLFALAALQFNCGGGSDVGNPDISGRIARVDGSPVMACTVIVGPRDCRFGEIDTIELNDGVTIYMEEGTFDTITTDQDGVFRFVNVMPGPYSILAQKDNLYGINKFDHLQYVDSKMNIEITNFSTMIIDNYDGSMDTSVKSFASARISGTPLVTNTKPDQYIYFPRVPSGLLDIILYRKNGGLDNIRNLDVIPLDSIIIMVDPSKKPQEWTYQQKRPMAKSRPYISLYRLMSVDDTSSYNVQYDFSIQFSHPMEAWSIKHSVSVFSSDGLATLTRAQPEGANGLLVDICPTGTEPCSEESAGLKKGITYSIVIDTTAQSIDGYSLAWPDTITFTP